MLLSSVHKILVNPSFFVTESSIKKGIVSVENDLSHLAQGNTTKRATLHLYLAGLFLKLKKDGEDVNAVSHISEAKSLLQKESKEIQSFAVSMDATMRSVFSQKLFAFFMVMKVVQVLPKLADETQTPLSKIATEELTQFMDQTSMEINEMVRIQQHALDPVTRTLLSFVQWILYTKNQVLIVFFLGGSIFFLGLLFVIIRVFLS